MVRAGPVRTQSEVHSLTLPWCAAVVVLGAGDRVTFVVNRMFLMTMWTMRCGISFLMAPGYRLS